MNKKLLINLLIGLIPGILLTINLLGEFGNIPKFVYFIPIPLGICIGLSLDSSSSKNKQKKVSK